jgi:hypothetical protein
MKTYQKILAGWLVGFSLLALTAPAWSASTTASYAGLVIAVNKAAGTIVMGDTGPRLTSGESKVTRHTIKVTPSTEFVRVKRATGVAPSGWLGDYEETKLSAWEVKAGDWVAIALEPGKGRATAAKITVVDTSEP